RPGHDLAAFFRPRHLRRDPGSFRSTGGWWTENQAFNVQKNSELNLEHAYSELEHWGVYYYLLQIAHLLLQLVEKGSLLRQLAQRQGYRSAVAMYGSLKNMAIRLLESLRNRVWPEQAYGPARLQIRFDS